MKTNWENITRRSSRVSIIFALAFMVMVSGIYPNYNIIEFDSERNGCFLSSVAHHYIGNAICFGILSVTSGGLSYIFVPSILSEEKKDKSVIATLIFCWTFIILSITANYWGVVTMADFFEHSSQLAIRNMSQPLDHYICPEQLAKGN